MTSSTQSRGLRPRFPLFSKIIAGFAVVILIMVGLSITTMVQIETLLSASQVEFRVIPHIQTMKELWEIEHDAAQKYFETKKSSDQQKLDFTVSQFRQAVDSLIHMTDTSNQFLKEIVERQNRFESFLKKESEQLANNPHLDAVSELQAHNAEPDSMIQSMRSLSDIYLPPWVKGWKSFNDRIPIVITTVYFIMILALAISGVVALFVARTVTRPIQALKAGTEKVSEAQYESVPITSNDEIAELTVAFNSMSEKLKQLDEMRMQLMSEISHEMRTPLQVIKAGCYSIIHTKDGPSLTQRQRDAVGMIHQATNRINQFVNSFLDIAKMEAGLMKFNFESVNLVDILNPLVQEAQLIAQTRQITVAFTSDEVPLMMIDKDRMSQVFSNLLSNALKYTPDSGTISLSIVKTNECESVGNAGLGCVKLEVQDSGVGIPEADLAKLFNKFYQAKNVPLVNEKGSGLGLALVKHVTEAHGGRVSVRSQVGFGSTFTILLPLRTT